MARSEVWRHMRNLSTWQYYGPEAGALPTAGGYTGVRLSVVLRGSPRVVCLRRRDRLVIELHLLNGKKLLVIFAALCIWAAQAHAQAAGQTGPQQAPGNSWMTQPLTVAPAYKAARDRVTSDFLRSKRSGDVVRMYVSAAQSEKGNALAAFCGATAAMLAADRAASYKESNDYYLEAVQSLNQAPAQSNYEYARLRFIFAADTHPENVGLLPVATRLLSVFGSDPLVLGAAGGCFFDPLGPDKGAKGIALVEREIKADPNRSNGYFTLAILYNSVAECYDDPRFAKKTLAALDKYLSICKTKGDIRDDAATMDSCLKKIIAKMDDTPPANHAGH